MGEEGESKYGAKETEIPGPTTAKRGCRDILCVIIFIVAWLAWIIIALMAFTDGCPDNCNDPQKLIYGFDSSGCMCGKNCTDDGLGDNTGMYSMYMPNPLSPDERVCMETCPPAFSFNKTEAEEVGAYKCPGGNCTLAGRVGLFFFNQRNKGDFASGDGATDNCFLPTSNGTECWYPTYPSSEVFFKCIPAMPANLTKEDLEKLAAVGLPVDNAEFAEMLNFMSNPGGEIGTITAELVSTWYIVLAGCGMAVVMGFAFLMCIRLLAVPCTYLTMIGLLLMLTVSTLLAFDRTGKIQLVSQLDTVTGQNISALADEAESSYGEAGVSEGIMEAISWVLAVISVIYLLVMIFMFKRILIAVKVIVEAAKAISAMPLLVLQPLWTFSFLSILYLWTVAVTMYLMSAGEFDPTTGTFVYKGGTCTADITDLGINTTTNVLLISLTLGSAVRMRTGEISTDSGATWAALSGAHVDTSSSPNALLLADSTLKGTSCKYDAIFNTDKCTGNTNTSSAVAMPIGGCLGVLSNNNCSDDTRNKDFFTTPSGMSNGTISWNATAGEIKLWIQEGQVLGPGTITIAAKIRRCTSNGTCGAWDLTGGAVGNTSWGWRLKSEHVLSYYNFTYLEAVRKCNVLGTTAKSLPILTKQKDSEMKASGLADMRELPDADLKFDTLPTIDNWRSFIPIPLDGTTYNYLCLAHLFMFLWTNNFTTSSGYYVIAGAVATWYWTLDKMALPRFPITGSAYRYVRYNLGTVLVGSFIIAVVQFIRIVMNYFVSKTKALENNPAVKAIMCIVNCCLWCLEKFIGYINKNAYIMSATHGHGFCKGAFQGFMLLMRNIMRVAAVNATAIVILFFGKLLILAANLTVVYLICSVYAVELQLASGPPMLTLVVVAFCTWFIASSFLSTFEAAIDCIFLSFLYDQEVNDGKDKPYFMAASLQAAIGVKNNQIAPDDKK
mmetsp:Transcript_60527/g.143932  ORF Transcript_60527/g.143932 Transcript_60527/m.143932 type:complete len:950 (+) Transcript_60527:231-3080(+)